MRQVAGPGGRVLQAGPERRDKPGGEGARLEGCIPGQLPAGSPDSVLKLNRAKRATEAAKGAGFVAKWQAVGCYV